MGRSDFLRRLGEGCPEALAQSFVPVQHGPGDTVLAEGDEGDAMYIVAGGSGHGARAGCAHDRWGVHAWGHASGGAAPALGTSALCVHTWGCAAPEGPHVPVHTSCACTQCWGRDTCVGCMCEAACVCVHLPTRVLVHVRGRLLCATSLQRGS